MIAADLGIPTRRLLGQERDSGHDINLGPLRVEVKRRKRVANLYEWLSGADVVALRGDGKEWLVTMPWPLFCKLVREELGGNDGRMGGGEIGGVSECGDRSVS